jgi:hypothetical protein
MPDKSLFQFEFVAHLGHQAREAIRRGKLPSLRANRTWVGTGVGAVCTICGRPVTKDHMAFEVELARNGPVPGLDKYHFHIPCFTTWEFERSKIDGTAI